MAKLLRTVSLLILSQVPLVGTALTLRLQDSLSSLPLSLIIGVVLLYEFIVFIFIFVQKVWRKFEDNLVELTANEIEYTIISLITRFSYRYRKQIYFDHRIFNVNGLRIQGMQAIEVEQVFVDLRIAPGYSQETGSNLLSSNENSESQSIWKFLQRLKKEDGFALAIIGSPGCGKTTLLQHVALTLAKKKQRRYGFNKALIPIFLFLRQHVDSILHEIPPNLDELVQKHYSNKNLYPLLNPPSGWFRKQLSKGKCLVLLDGLDEVAKPEERKKVSQWVDQQIRIYPRNEFVLTARPYGYKDAPLGQAHVLEIMSFNHLQVQQFISSWYLTNTIFSYGKDDYGVRQAAKRKADHLLYRLNKPAFKDLMRNPLLLTMVTMVHNYRNVLPEHRVELYNEICNVLLSHWGKAKDLEDRFGLSQKRLTLYPLAAYLMKHKSREIPFEKALAVMEPSLKQIGLSSSEGPMFLRHLQNTSGLILEKEVGVWSFAHLTFQEYLCAAYWKEPNKLLDWETPDWDTLVTDGWWTETLLLYAALSDASALATACLKHADNLVAMSLACSIAEEAEQLSPSIRKQLDMRINRHLESTNKELFRQAARVLLYRRLQVSNFQDIDEFRKISPELVTCAEYQLFLDDVREQGKFCYPEHWDDGNFPRTQAKLPITGVSYTDAEVFCAWLSKTQGQQYRLPTIEEISAFPNTKVPALAVWTKDQVLLPIGSESEMEIKSALDSIASIEFPFLPDFLKFTNVCENVQTHKYEIAYALHGVLVNEDIHKEIKEAQKREERLNIVIDLHNEVHYIYGRKNEIQQDLKKFISQHPEQASDWEKQKVEELQTKIRAFDKDFDKLQERIRTEENSLRRIYPDLPVNAKISLLKDKISTEQAQVIRLQKKLSSDESIENERTLLANVLEYSIMQKQERALAIALYLTRFFNILHIDGNNLDNGMHYLSKLFAQNLKPVKRRQVTLLKIAVEAAVASEKDDFFGWRRKNFELLLHIAEYAYLSSKELQEISSASKSSKNTQKENDRESKKYFSILQQMDKVRRTTFELYWYYRIIKARTDGEIPAWGSIRIVQEE